MLGLSVSTKHEKKCNATYGTMGHLDPKQPPVKRKPFAALLNNNFIQKTELILPEELFEIIKTDLLPKMESPSYSRVILPLQALLEGDFFNEYIKRGNILMLSEGGIGSKCRYSLIDGILTLYLDKESYERAGLVGKPDGVKGGRGTKPRWVVQIELRLPSMLHGKKGFDRILYAFKNVLNTPVTWLFCDLGITALKSDPMDAHFPIKVTMAPQIQSHINVRQPNLQPPIEANPDYDDDFEDFVVEIHEWIALISLGSPRLNPNDRIDPFLSRYCAPGGSTETSRLIKITWRGFLAPFWVHGLFAQAVLTSPNDSWFALNVCGFSGDRSGRGKDCTILKLPQKEYVLWEVE